MDGWMNGSERTWWNDRMDHDALLEHLEPERSARRALPVPLISGYLGGFFLQHVDDVVDGHDAPMRPSASTTGITKPISARRAGPALSSGPCPPQASDVGGCWRTARCARCREQVAERHEPPSSFWSVSAATGFIALEPRRGPAGGAGVAIAPSTDTGRTRAWLGVISPLASSPRVREQRGDFLFFVCLVEQREQLVTLGVLRLFARRPRRRRAAAAHPRAALRPRSALMSSRTGRAPRDRGKKTASARAAGRERLGPVLRRGCAVSPEVVDRRPACSRFLCAGVIGVLRRMCAGSATQPRAAPRVALRLRGSVELVTLAPAPHGRARRRMSTTAMITTAAATSVRGGAPPRERPAERHRDDRVHERVRAHDRGRHRAQQVQVRGEADDGAGTPRGRAAPRANASGPGDGTARTTEQSRQREHARAAREHADAGREQRATRRVRSRAATTASPTPTTPSPRYLSAQKGENSASFAFRSPGPMSSAMPEKPSTSPATTQARAHREAPDRRDQRHPQRGSCSP